MVNEAADRSEAAQAGQEAPERAIDLVSLYPQDMNIYGDSGNVLTVSRRLALYGYQPRIHRINQGDAWPDQVDMILGGGGQDHGQGRIIDDLFERADTLRAAAEAGVPMLMVCGLYQLFGHYFETIDGERLDGIGIIGAYSLGRPVRMIGNLVEHTDSFGDAIGYENHSGQTFLDPGVEPLGRVDADGCGNNGEDRTEGARVHNVIGTYLHGSLLPKNPAISDFLIRTAVEARYGQGSFDPAAAPGSAELARLDEAAAQARQAASARPR
ncbi:type 1 glutamine amidotransferase [Bifidobacterium actinocoloniiforme]|nr:glutamine amidotransferase [Bifidobacterium actinocoloniiforme]AKV55689.1 glutamine amidotransferase [Bifidobacterium actinocoloniiforme DSM 22766]